MIETKRLIVRPFVAEDFNELLRHRSDPLVMKYLSGVPTEEAVRTRLEFYIDHFAEWGFAMGALIWKETGAFIGVGGLQQLEDGSDVEVGYTVDKAMWGKGIATECTFGCLALGFEKFDLKRIIAQTDANNLASRRVLEKAGMTFLDRVDTKAGEWVRYSILAS